MFNLFMVHPGNLTRTHGMLVQRNALNPLIWFEYVAIPGFLWGAYNFQNDKEICMLLIYAALISGALFVIAYFYLLFRKPEKLQSEAYQLRHEAMQLYQDKASTIDVTEDGIQAIISNPEGRPE